MKPPRNDGFTLLEVCLAMVIGLILVTLAVPSISGVLDEQRLKRCFEDLDHFVQSAKMRSIRERRDYVMTWDDKGIKLAPANLDVEGVKKSPAKEKEKEGKEPDRFTFGKKQTYQLLRTAALTGRAPREWTFWKSGMCEPIQITFQGDAGKWTVRYDPLTVRGVFLESQVR